MRTRAPLTSIWSNERVFKNCCRPSHPSTLPHSLVSSITARQPLAQFGHRRAPREPEADESLSPLQWAHVGDRWAREQVERREVAASWQGAQVRHRGTPRHAQPCRDTQTTALMLAVRR